MPTERSRVWRPPSKLLGPTSVHSKPLLTALKTAQERLKVGPHSRAFGLVQAGHRACQEACCSCRRCQGCRAENNFRSRSCPGGATSHSASGQTATPSRNRSSRAAGQGVDLLVRERDALKSTPARQVGGGEGSATWMSSGPPCEENIPPMHTSDLQDLERWMCEASHPGPAQEACT